MNDESPSADDYEMLCESWLASQRSRNTRAAYRSDIARFRSWCAETAVSYSTPSAGDLDRYRHDFEAANSSPASISRRMSAVSSFLAYLATQSVARSVGLGPRDKPRAGGLPTPVEGASSTLVLTTDDAAALLAAADRINPRSALLIRLLLLDGLKVSEAVDVDAADVTGKPPRLSLAIRHDERTRSVALHPSTSAIADTYLAGRRRGPLVLSESRARAPGRLTRFGVDYVVKHVAKAAGVAGPVSANALRRRFVVHAHERGATLDEIRDLAGHADTRTTRRYLPEA